MVRLSGQGVAGVTRAVCRHVDFERPRESQLVEVHGRGGEALDRAVVTVYRGPRSYTGEDMLEMVVHGSPFVVRALVDSCVAAGAREAAPGEFTRRAVANGKLDLLQAEAIADLVQAETESQARNARRQLGGELSTQVGQLRGDMVELLAALEGSLEFAEERIGEAPEELRARRDRCLAGIEDLLTTAVVGERLRNGVRVVIGGPPNSGKSTLFNYLLNEERAIVSPQEGTTRDLVGAAVELGGAVVELVDTAGLRDETMDKLEAEGVRRARAALATADVAVVLWPSDSPLAPSLPQGPQVVRIRSKADLDVVGGGERGGEGWLRVSCVTGEGVEELGRRLTEAVAVEGRAEGGGVAIGARHRVRLERAAEELRRCQVEHVELACEAVRWAQRELAEITGEVVDEEVLGAIFARFCVGK